MIQLADSAKNIEIIQGFIDETRKRIIAGTEITFTNKAVRELEELMLNHDFNADTIENVIFELQTKNYYRGIDPSGKGDFNVCAFSIHIGIEVKGSQILIFSNHSPKYPIKTPFKN